MNATYSIVLDGFPSGHPVGCRGCVERVVERVRALAGVDRVEAAADNAGITCAYDPAIIAPDLLDQAAHQALAESGNHWRFQSLAVEGMDCADCARTLERGIARIPGVAAVDVSFGSARLDVEYDTRRTSQQALDKAVRELGYALSSSQVTNETERGALSRLLRRRDNLLALASGVFLLSGLVMLAFNVASAASTALFVSAIAVGGVPLALKGVRAVRLTRAPDINILMTIAVLGAAALGDWVEAATVVFLFSLGEALEGYAMDRVRRSVRALLALAPPVATVLRGGREREAPVGDVLPGERIVVRPGQRLPLDGVVVHGVSHVDQSSLTGESVPVLKEPGAEVFAGTMNADGALTVQVTRPAADSSVARVIHLVEQAQGSRAPVQRMVDRFAAVYTPAVIALAVAIAVVPPLLGGDTREWVGRALVLLVIACPCALVISTPVSIVSALSAAARRGILIKGGAALERAGTIDTIALDKTGTLTLGRPVVSSVMATDGRSAEDVVYLAATLERHSEHPLGRAIVDEAQRRGLQLGVTRDMRAIPGSGIVGRVDGTPVRAGSTRMFADIALPTAAQAAIAEIEARGGAVVLLGDDTQVFGVIGFADEAREESRSAIAALRAAGIRRVVMLTGDGPEAAQRVADGAGVDAVYARLLPEDKLASIQKMRGARQRVAMVGDGINDAPALAAADLGIAMGVVGSDAAIESADIALMGDDLHGVAASLELGKRTRRTIGLNVSFSIVVKLLTLGLAVAGFASLWMAIAADVGASLLVVANGLLLLRWKGGKQAQTPAKAIAP